MTSYGDGRPLLTPVDQDAPRRSARLRRLGLGERADATYDSFDAFADRVDTLSEVAKRHKANYLEAVQDVQRLTARVTELEAELAGLREPSAEPPTD